MAAAVRDVAGAYTLQSSSLGAIFCLDSEKTVDKTAFFAYAE